MRTAPAGFSQIMSQRTDVRPLATHDPEFHYWKCHFQYFNLPNHHLPALHLHLVPPACHLVRPDPVNTDGRIRRRKLFNLPDKLLDRPLQTGSIHLFIRKLPVKRCLQIIRRSRMSESNFRHILFLLSHILLDLLCLLPHTNNHHSRCQRIQRPRVPHFYLPVSFSQANTNFVHHVKRCPAQWFIDHEHRSCPKILSFSKKNITPLTHYPKTIVNIPAIAQ